MTSWYRRVLREKVLNVRVEIVQKKIAVKVSTVEVYMHSSPQTDT